MTFSEYIISIRAYGGRISIIGNALVEHKEYFKPFIKNLDNYGHCTISSNIIEYINTIIDNWNSELQLPINHIRPSALYSALNETWTEYKTKELGFKFDYLINNFK